MKDRLKQWQAWFVLGLLALLLNAFLDRAGVAAGLANALEQFGWPTVILSLLWGYRSWRRRRMWWIHRQLRSAFINSALIPLALSGALMVVIVLLFLWILASQMARFYAEHWMGLAMQRSFQCLIDEAADVVCPPCKLNKGSEFFWTRKGKWAVGPPLFRKWMGDCVAPDGRLDEALLIMVDNDGRKIRWGVLSAAMIEDSIRMFGAGLKGIDLIQLPLNVRVTYRRGRGSVELSAQGDSSGGQGLDPYFQRIYSARSDSAGLNLPMIGAPIAVELNVPFFFMPEASEHGMHSGLLLHFDPRALMRVIFSTQHFTGLVGVILAAAFATLACAIGLFVLLLLVLGYRTSRRVGRAVETIADAMRRISEGRFPIEVAIQRKDQMGHLARQIEAMSRSLAHLFEEKVSKELLEREIEIARTVQGRLFPSAPPVWPGLDIAVRLIPAQRLSGDYYDFFRSEGSLGIVVADVVGKGFPASLLMANLHALLHLAHRLVKGPDEIPTMLEIVNRHLVAHTEPHQFVTMFYAAFLSGQDRFIYAGAGHPPALLYCHDQVRWLHSTGTILGAFPDREWTVQTTELPENGFLVLYSDGLLEATNEAGQEYGQEGIASLMRRLVRSDSTAQQALDAILADVAAWSANREPSDDTVLIVIRRMKAAALD